MSKSFELVPINAAGSSPLLWVPTAEKASLHITALPGTDLWRMPPAHDVFNAPCYVLTLPAPAFRRARVTVSAEWMRQYDQGGLVIFLPAWPGRAAWIKVGIENYNGAPHVSVVATRGASDWSLCAGTKQVTLEIEREAVDVAAGTGTSLWVYFVEDGVRSAVREVTWLFADERDSAGMVSVGIYAARPTKEGDLDVEGLFVTFNDLRIEFDV